MTSEHLRYELVYNGDKLRVRSFTDRCPRGGISGTGGAAAAEGGIRLVDVSRVAANICGADLVIDGFLSVTVMVSDLMMSKAASHRGVMARGQGQTREIVLHSGASTPNQRETRQTCET